MADSSQSSLENDKDEKSSPGFFMRSCIKTFKLKFPSVKNITTQELTRWLASFEERSVVLLDCRPEEEYIVSHIEGAIRTDHEMTDVKPIAQTCEEKFQDKPQPTIVCYCSVGYRSSVLAEKLQKYYQSTEMHSKPDVYNLEGSLFQWANERKPMVDSEGHRTPFAHPYSAAWGKLLDKSLRKEKL